MSMIHCKECGAEVSKSAKVCPKCGKKLKHNGLRIVIGIILIFIGLGVIFSVDTTTNTSQKNNSNTPDETLEFIEELKNFRNNLK